MINYLHHLELINKETYMNIYKDQLNDKEILNLLKEIANQLISNFTHLLFLSNVK